MTRDGLTQRVARLAGVAGLLAVLAGCDGAGEPGAPREPGRWELIEHLSNASFHTGSEPIRHTFTLREATVRDRDFRCLQAVPPSRLTLDVDVPAAARLTGTIGLHPTAWEMPGDGVDFRIEVLDGERRAVVYGRSVYPYLYPADRRPMSVNVDLGEYAGRRVTFAFITGPGPSGNAVYDAALWCGIGIE